MQESDVPGEFKGESKGAPKGASKGSKGLGVPEVMSGEVFRNLNTPVFFGTPSALLIVAPP